MAIATFDLSRFLGQAALALNRPEIGGKKVQNKRNGLCHYGRKWKTLRRFAITGIWSWAKGSWWTTKGMFWRWL